MSNTPYKPIVCQQFTYTTTSNTPVDVKGAQRLVLRTTTDCYVDFDQPVAPTTSYLISASNTADTTIELTGGSISNVYFQAKTSGGIAYIIAIIN